MTFNLPYIVVEKLPQGWTPTLRREVIDSFAKQNFGTNIERNSSGKPFLTNSNIFISISHTSNFYAIMVSNSVCGVDIELVSRKCIHLSNRFASQDELEICKEVFDLNPALLIWCTKEALFKYLGRDGVDFKDDLKLVGATQNTIKAVADNDVVNLKWYIDNNDLLVVYTE